MLQLLAVILDGVGAGYLPCQQRTEILLKIFLECRSRSSNDALGFAKLAIYGCSIRKRIGQFGECRLAEFASPKQILQVFEEGSFISLVLNLDL